MCLLFVVFVALSHLNYFFFYSSATITLSSQSIRLQIPNTQVMYTNCTMNKIFSSNLNHLITLEPFISSRVHKRWTQMEEGVLKSVFVSISQSIFIINLRPPFPRNGLKSILFLYFYLIVKCQTVQLWMNRSNHNSFTIHSFT